MMRLAGDTVNPPGAFFYIVPETGVRVPLASSTSLYGCIRLVVEHYRANGYEVPANLKETIEDFACRAAPPGFCLGEDSRPQRLNTSPSLGTQADQVWQGTKTIAGWLVAGSVPVEQAKSRASVCLGCPKHGTTTCPRCKQGLLDRLKRFVTTTLKREPEPWEADLKACAVCGCSLQLKVHVPLDVILKNTPKNQLAAFPPHCWVVTEQAPPP